MAKRSCLEGVNGFLLVFGALTGLHVVVSCRLEEAPFQAMGWLVWDPVCCGL